MVNGTTVPQDTRRGHEDLQPPFTTYYEQIDGKYWFPTYTKAEGVLHFPASNGGARQDVHMRNIVRYTDYKQFRATSRIIYNGEDITNNRAPEDDKNKQQQPQQQQPQQQPLTAGSLRSAAAATAAASEACVELTSIIVPTEAPAPPSSRPEPASSRLNRLSGLQTRSSNVRVPLDAPATSSSEHPDRHAAPSSAPIHHGSGAPSPTEVFNIV